MHKFHKLLLLLPFLFLLSGTAFAQEESNTIFGALSDKFQFGGTEEKIFHKKPVDNLFVTFESEVLMDRPGKFTVYLTDRETGQGVENLPVQVEICMVAYKEDNDPCSDETRSLALQHVSNGRYESDLFEWPQDLEHSDYWRGDVQVMTADGSNEPLPFDLGLYPSRPASSNAFELINISLPYVIIGLFVGIVVLRKKKFMHLPTA